jgi:hypothetical protein
MSFLARIRSSTPAGAPEEATPEADSVGSGAREPDAVATDQEQGPVAGNGLPIKVRPESGLGLL